MVSFDVTPDVAAILSGADAGLGWLVKKVNETLSGSIQFNSREAGVPPRLRLRLDTPTPVCTPTAASDTVCNGIDDDCDGATDEDFVVLTTSVFEARARINNCS